MCDYSLHAVDSRPARVGEKLISTRFQNSTTRGFSSTDDPDIAVCLLAGTEVAFEHEVEYYGALRFIRRHNLTQRVARFRQIYPDHRTAHHDALEFPSGEIILLTNLCEGQRATVLQLPATKSNGINVSVRENAAAPL